jgi:hypothetical protein
MLLEDSILPLTGGGFNVLEACALLSVTRAHL